MSNCRTGLYEVLYFGMQRLRERRLQGAIVVSGSHAGSVCVCGSCCHHPLLRRGGSGYQDGHPQQWYRFPETIRVDCLLWFSDDQREELPCGVFYSIDSPTEYVCLEVSVMWVYFRGSTLRLWHSDE